jgi:acyl carrier protein
MSVEQTIRDLISANVARFDGNMVKADGLLIDSGLDSLDIATVLLEVQEAFDIVLPEGREDEYDTLAKLTAFVEAARA